MERLGRLHEISHDYEPPNLTDAGGHEVVAYGIILLQWKWIPHGTQIHECKFFVLGSPNVDVVFGVDYIMSEGLFSINEWAMQVIGSPKIFERHAVRRNRLPESDTLSRDPLQLIVRSFSSNISWLFYRRITSLTDPVLSRNGMQLHR